MNPPHDDRTRSERIADHIASFGGSWWFIISALCVMSAWASWNLLATKNLQFDPYPFILLNLLLSMVAAFQAPFILMSQGRAEKKAEAAHRRTLHGIRRLIKKDIRIEKEILMILKNQNKDVENQILDLLKKS
jgi:uncharacterized membrane protein